MLIIPLHKRPTAENFPLVTLILILVNCFVYLFLQSGDAAVLQRAATFYRSSGLVALEEPAYLAHLRNSGEAEMADQLAEIEEPVRSHLLLRALQNDSKFQKALAAHQVVRPEHAQFARWQQLRADFNAIWAAQFTDRFLLRYSELDLVRLLSSMFLHGDVGHLIGNMLFLAFLGLLVEGALGPRLFLVLYLVGGLGGSLFSLARNWGEVGGALGASGAIAALMGAYCVLWGLRKVRFFWWFFVVFDYVKAPALLLLPAWLGWELFNMWTNADAGVGFDAHAGGIMTGALLALGVRRLRWERRAFLDEEQERDTERELYDQAMSHFGKLEFAKARVLLADLVQRRPTDLAVLVPLFRCWQVEPASGEFHTAARRVLLHPSTRHEDVAQMRSVFTDYLSATGNRPRLAAAELLSLARRWTAIGATDDAEKMLVVLASKDAQLSGLAEALFELALALRERQQAEAYRRLLQRLVDRCPDSALASKARFLLSNG